MFQKQFFHWCYRTDDEPFVIEMDGENVGAIGGVPSDPLNEYEYDFDTSIEIPAADSIENESSVVELQSDPLDTLKTLAIQPAVDETIQVKNESSLDSANATADYTEDSDVVEVMAYYVCDEDGVTNQLDQ